ncbi:Cytochrome P450 86A2 [Hibiscus syriacus]|uniref:Cytochrome P450 86A2 n=1 Tax=Hibiscus syriacus TaxID=106335 RepID=A0A6A2ZAB6_HIBSY|nr:Cytochrome P450 86A2 [Hibiscus syriacus]
MQPLQDKTMGSFISSPIFLLFLFLPIVASLPLSTNSRWIVDEGNRRIKLVCVNWVSHLEPILAEGHSRQPVNTLAKKIVSMGFNCVRFTWPRYLITNDSLSSLTVRQSFQRLGLLESIAGIQANNPSIVNVTLVKAYQAVVSLGENNVMVILGNHISTPGWCCSNFDGSGFFGDKYFNPDLCITRLTRMATLFNCVTNVVGMINGKLVFEAHWYRQPERSVLQSGKKRDEDIRDNNYMNCFLGVAAELDLDWALWTLVGSYYLREGPGLSEAKLHKVIFHPLTGLYVTKKSLLEPLHLGPCTDSDPWSYSPHKLVDSTRDSSVEQPLLQYLPGNGFVSNLLVGSM